MGNHFDPQKYRRKALPSGISNPLPANPPISHQPHDGVKDSAEGESKQKPHDSKPLQAKEETVAKHEVAESVEESHEPRHTKQPASKLKGGNIEHGSDLTAPQPTGFKRSLKMIQSILKENSSGHNADKSSSATQTKTCLNSKSSIVPHGAKDLKDVTPEEQLRQIQLEQVKAIRLRSRTRDTTQTTSLSDLHFARQPVDNTSNQVLQMFRPSISNQPTHVAGLAPLVENDPVSSKTASRTKSSLRASRWADSHQLKSVAADVDVANISDGAGSGILSAASASSDSIRAMHDGKVHHRPSDIGRDSRLFAFNGMLQPAPVDWHDRPSFVNSDPSFKDNFRRWLEDTVRLTLKRDVAKTLSDFKPIPLEQLENLHLHPDGIGFVDRYLIVDRENAASYGYEDVPDATKYSRPISRRDIEEDWGKLDLSRNENKDHSHERTEDYVRGWNANLAKYRKIHDARWEAKLKAKESRQIFTWEIAPYEPALNIYVRPAVKTDIPQMASIYNYYVQHGCCTAELVPIVDRDMQDRLMDSKSNVLPFLVAVLKNKKSKIPHDTSAEHQAWQNNGQSNPNLTSTQKVMGGIEKIVGWTSAQDFTAQDFVERISVEMELYVHPDFRQKGVARCLLDQMMHSLDRGYIKQGGYEFTCAPELKDMYSVGGARDVHKVMIVVRKYTHPHAQEAEMAAVTQGSGQAMSNEKPNDREDDFDKWKKTWLEKCGFRVEGVLSEAGAKKGRYVDLVYMARQTMWQPSEGLVPEPHHGR